MSYHALTGMVSSFSSRLQRVRLRRKSFIPHPYGRGIEFGKITALLGVVAVLTVGGMARAAPVGTIPAADQARGVAKAARAPVIDGDWGLTPRPYYVLSESLILKALLGVNHQFDGVFSTELSATQLGWLKRLGVKTEPVRLHRIIGKPVCGDGIVHPSEKCGEPGLASCPEGSVCVDCRCVTEEEVCYPSSPYPWGIVKVNGGSGGTGVTVAVLDTGVDQDHPDLQDNIVACVTKVTHFKPDSRSCEDGGGHGTHVSGTVLANGGPQGLGIYGVAPEANLMTVKVCDKRGWCYGDDIAAGIFYAVDGPDGSPGTGDEANIISMSFGSDLPDSQVLVAIDYAADQGVLPVAAGGNSGPAEDSIIYPAAYYKVMGIAAIDEAELVASWSSRGLSNGDDVIDERELDLATPGVDVESTWNDGCYHVGNGTSMATPHVSGLAAKLWQGSAAATRKYLDFDVVKDLDPVGHDPHTGFGLPIAP